MIQPGVEKGKLVLNWVAIGIDMDTPNTYSLANGLRAMPDGAMVNVESSMLSVLPDNMMGIAMGLHVRCGSEEKPWAQDRSSRMSSMRQIEQLMCISREFDCEIATSKQAHELCRIGVFYYSVEETMALNGFSPNAKGRQQGYLHEAA